MYKTDIVNHHSKNVQKEITDFLAPDEKYNLFILGNLGNKNIPACLYTIRKEGNIVGVAGYYPSFKSFMPFSRDPQAIKILTQHAIARHPIKFLLAIEFVGKHALEVFKKEPSNDFNNLFMELDIKEDFTPNQPIEGNVRLATPSDELQIAILTRYLRNAEATTPLNKNELVNAMLCPHICVYEKDNKIVSLASSNGIGIEAIKILQVVTTQESRQQGYATATCSYLIEHMHSLGAKKAYIFTSKENIAARKCYEKLGFKTTDNFYFVHF